MAIKINWCSIKNQVVDCVIILNSLKLVTVPFLFETLGDFISGVSYVSPICSDFECFSRICGG